MSRYRYLLLVFSFVNFQLSAMDGGDFQNCLQRLKTEAAHKNAKEKYKKKKDKRHKPKAFFEQIRSQAESQSEFLTTKSQLETNQNLLNLLDQNKEVIQKASPQEQVVISNLVQHPFFYESDQDAAMGEILVNITRGVMKGMVKRGTQWSCDEGRNEILSENISSLAQVIKGSFMRDMKVFLTYF